MVFGHAVVRNALLFSTTHHKERLDPGRMDMHIHLSYCNFSAFEQLAFNYPGISQHKLFEQIEGLLREVKVIGEGIQDIVKFLHSKKMCRKLIGVTGRYS